MVQAHTFNPLQEAGSMSSRLCLFFLAVTTLSPSMDVLQLPTCQVTLISQYDAQQYFYLTPDVAIELSQTNGRHLEL